MMRWKPLRIHEEQMGEMEYTNLYIDDIENAEKSNIIQE